MNTKIKMLFTILLMLALVCAVTSCVGTDNPPARNGTDCQHRDDDDNSLCDKCGEPFSDSTDCQHRDADDNSLCDKCGEPFSDGTDCQHRDADDNSRCDKCDNDYVDGYEIAEGATQGVIYKIVRGTYAEVIDYVGFAEDVIISDTYQGLPVKVIGIEAFDSKGNITSVTIPNSVKTIERSAFNNCSLESISIGSGIVGIGREAFSHCGLLKEVHISDLTAWCNIHYYDENSNPLFLIGNTYNERNLYVEGKLVTELVIPDGLTEINSFAFAGCTSITSVVIPETVTAIGEGAFYECMNLEAVYYGGTEAEWTNVSLGAKNTPISNAKLYFYNNDTPPVAGKYWHYDSDGKIQIWQ